MGSANSKFSFDLLHALLTIELSLLGTDEGLLANSTVVEAVGKSFTLTSQACFDFCGYGWAWYPVKDILDRLVSPESYSSPCLY